MVMSAPSRKAPGVVRHGSQPIRKRASGGSARPVYSVTTIGPLTFDRMDKEHPLGHVIDMTSTVQGNRLPTPAWRPGDHDAHRGDPFERAA